MNQASAKKTPQASAERHAGEPNQTVFLSVKSGLIKSCSHTGEGQQMNSGSNWKKRWKWPFKTHDSESRLALGGGEEERLAGGGGEELVKGTRG